LKGKQVTFTIIDPANYSDYALDGTLIAKSLKSAGIDAIFDGTSDNAWYADLADGNFQAAVHWSSGGTVPYVTYDNWLDSTLSTGANAKNASGDLERLNNKTVDAELAKLAGAATPAAQLAALAPLEAFIIQDLPVIPILYGVGFDEYNTGQFTGFPSPANPYEGGQPTSPTDEVVVLHLTPVS
jgi:peptide/nickel transport system substrate-binding protein